MKLIMKAFVFLFSAQFLFAETAPKPSWEYGTKGMLEISGNISGWYETGYSSKSFTALAYPELGYFFSQKWYASTSTALEYFYSEYPGSAYPTSNLNFMPNIGLGRTLGISPNIYINLHSAIGGEYIYCFYPHCSSSWVNGLKVIFDPSIKFLLKESVFLNLTWGFRGYFDLGRGRFENYLKTALILGFSYAF